MGLRTWDDTCALPASAAEATACRRDPDRRVRSFAIGGGVALLGIALIGLVGASLDTSPIVIVGTRTAQLTVGLVLVVLSRLAVSVNGDRRASGLTTSATLFAGVLALDLVETEPPGGLGDAIRAAVSIVAACRLATVFRHTGCSGTSSPGVDLLLGGAAVALLLAPLTYIGDISAARDIAPAAVLHLLVSASWAAAGFTLLRAPIETPLVRSVTIASFALQFSESARCLATLTDDRWLAPAAGARSAALLVVTIGALRILFHQARVQASTGQGPLRPTDGPARELTGPAHAHEVRNAVFAVEGASLVLLRLGPDLPADDRVRLSAAVSAGFQHLRELIDPEQPAPEHAEVLQLIAERVALAEARGVRVELTSVGHAWVRCPPVVVTQVLDNLVENAVEHGDALRHGLRIDLRIRSRRALVRVCDRGPGIPAGEVERVFDPQVRLHPLRRGDGLGLTISRHHARAWGGDLRVPSRRRRGACFEFTLPLASASSTPTGRCGDHRSPQSAPW
jgi:signal transduction histidine kinase